MSFEDWDFGEEHLNQSVNELTPEQMFVYGYEMFRETFGYTMSRNYVKDIAILKKFKKTYGKEAGKLLKWMFYRHNGTCDGQVFSFTWLASGRHWWVDQELHKMKENLGEIKTRRIPKQTKVGFMSVADMMRSAS